MSIIKKTEKTITAYEGGSGHIIEVIKEGDTVEFWISHKDYGVKSFMFGFHEADLKETLDDYISLFFLYEVEDYIRDYDEEYAD